MDDALVVLNAGSSSLKFSVFLPEGDELQLLFKGQISGLFVEPRFQAFREGAVLDSISWPKGHKMGHREAIEFLFEWGTSGPMQGHRAAAVGHRVVHGGGEFTKAVRIDGEVIEKLEKLAPLAPLHQPYNLSAIRAAAAYRPDLLQVAYFDTSFHQTAPPLAQAFALPRSYTDAGIRRYGFHGISYEYIASVLPAFDTAAARGRTIVAHLGNGASMCALKGGKSIATTTGFSAADGLPMGTRSGSLDPGVLIYLMDAYGLDARGLSDLINNKSGLLGVSEISSDMRELLSSGDARAAEAVDLFVYRIGREMGSLAAALGGLDALVFTGGVGENAAQIRSRVCKDSEWLGMRLDEEANNRGGPKISRGDSPVSLWVVQTNEELMIARHTLALMKKNGTAC
ncbi:MAG: acetate/propionate family kinase [Syntrophobacteraceae bacterium]